MTRPRALLALHAAVLLFGFAGLFGKWLAISPLLIVLGRTAIAAAVLGGLRARVAGRRRQARQLAGNGVVLAVHWIAFFAAIQASDVATGLLGFATFPLFTLVLGAAVGAERASPAEVGAALLVVLGLIVLTPAPSFADATFVGLAWGALSGATFALLALLNRRHAAGNAAVDIAFAQNFWAAVVLLPVVLVAAAATPDGLGHVGWRELGLLALLGVGCTALAHTLFVASLRELSAATASVATGLEPVYGIVLAYLFLGEVPASRSLAGGALILAASFVVALALRRPRSREH